MESTYVCLLPSENDAARLHRTFNAVFALPAFPCVQLPLHVTLYFFPDRSAEQSVDVATWVRNAGEAGNGVVEATIGHVQSFQKDGRDFVYYLPVSSQRITELHDGLHQKFKHIHTDPFAFVPHLSLFYPGRSLREEEKIAVQSIYRDIGTIIFDRLAFAAERGNGTHFLDVHIL